MILFLRSGIFFGFLGRCPCPPLYTNWINVPTQLHYLSVSGCVAGWIRMWSLGVQFFDLGQVVFISPWLNFLICIPYNSTQVTGFVLVTYQFVLRIEEPGWPEKLNPHMEATQQGPDPWRNNTNHMTSPFLGPPIGCQSLPLTEHSWRQEISFQRNSE